MARVRPSAAPIWGNCSAALVMQETHPETGVSESAETGTAAHWLAAEILSDYPRMSGVKLAFDYIGKFAPNGILITDEIAESVGSYINAVLKVCQKNGLLQKMQIEKHVLINRINPFCDGTPDLWIYDDDLNTLHVFDFKHGHGVVDVVENYQLICYAVGILDQITGDNALASSSIIVNFHIVQPLAYHPDGTDRVWHVNQYQLKSIVDHLTNQASLAISVEPTARSGSHCKYCTAITHCQTAQRAAANAIDFEQSLTEETIPNNLIALHRDQLLRAKSAIVDRLNGINSEIETKIANGETVDGLSMINKGSRLKWSKPDQEIITLAKLMDADLTKIVCCTPTQAKKLLDPALIDAYSTRSAGSKTIVKSDTTKAAKIFGSKQKVL